MAFLSLWRTRLAAVLAFALGALLLSSPAVSAQEATGTIEGRVLNGATGNYLSKARVVVEGTNLEAFTNDFGEYRINNVPAGSVQVRTSFTGQQTQVASVNVAAGASVTHNVEFSPRNDAVQLGQFVVEADRYKTAQEIAINEERFSVNIKNVVAADAFGEIPSGNVGEFIKYLPGIELEYGGTYTAPTDAMGISVRGFGAQDTAIYIDGVPVSSASQAALTTQVELDMLSINNASRVELIKVPTPDMPMNSVGGQINLISKSAFEYAKPTFTWKAYVTINSENPNPFERLPGPKAEKVYAGQPGFELSYIRPISKTLGLSLTASTYSQFSENRRFRPEWSISNVNVDLRPFGGASNTPATNANGPVSPSNPYLTRISLTDSPRTSRNYSASLKADWKPLAGLNLSGTYQISTYESADAARRIQFRTQRPMSWDATHTISYPFLQAGQIVPGQPSFNPSNSLEMNIDSRDKEGITHTASFRGTYQRGPWNIGAIASVSTSRASFKDFENGHFSTVDMSATIGQLKFENIKDGVPGSVTVYDRNGNVFDYTDLSKWSTPEIRGRSGLAESMDDKFYYKFDLGRDLDFLPWDFMHLKFQTGWTRTEEVKKKWGRGTNYREIYNGPALSVDDYLDTTYIGQDPGFGFPAQEWISTYRLYDIYAANPSNFIVPDPPEARENWFSLVGQNKRVKEVRDAWYAMFEGSTFGNRLNFVAGVRQENMKRRGQGPMGDAKWNFVKNPDGTLYRNPALSGTSTGLVRIDQANSRLFAQDAGGNALRADLTSKGISFPSAAIIGNTLARAMLERRLLQSVDGDSDGKPSPSINLSYDITSKLVGKLAWSRTFGRIPIEDQHRGLLSGNQNDFNINESEDPLATPRGKIRVANPNLLPEISDNWDFALSYYTESGGKFSASYYLKKVKNFSEEYVTTSDDPKFNEVLESLGLDPTEYQDWELTTAENGLGSGKVRGYELEVYQDLRFIPLPRDFGRRINVFATYSHSKRDESNTTRISARPAASQLATGGIYFSTNRLSMNLRASWRDLTFTGGQGNFTVDGVTYQLGAYDPSNTKVDANFEYRFSKRYSVYLSGKNIFATGLRKERFDLGGIYPAYAQWDDLREFGVQWTLGVRGSF